MKNYCKQKFLNLKVDKEISRELNMKVLYQIALEKCQVNFGDLLNVAHNKELVSEVPDATDTSHRNLEE